MRLLPLCLFVAPLLAQAQFEVLSPLVITGDKLVTQTGRLSGFASEVGPRRLDDLPRDSGTFQDLFGTQAGTQAGNPTAGLFSIRGLNQDNVFGYVGTGSNALIAVIEAGAPLSTATLRYLPPQLWDLAGAEVQRGPQSLSHGPNSLGGALVLHRREPDFGGRGQALVEFAEYGGFRAGLAQDLTLQPGRLALHVSYHRQQSDGQEYNRYYDDHALGANARDDARVTLLWQPDGRQDNRIKLSFEQDQMHGNPFANVTEAAPGDLFRREASLNTRAAYPAKRRAAVLSATLALPHDMELKSITSAQRLDIEALTDLDASSRLAWFARNTKDELRFTEDLTLTRRLGRGRWLLGGYAERSTYDQTYAGVGLAPLPFGSPFANIAAETVTIAAVYGRADWEFADHLHLNGGVRLNRERRDLNFTSSFGVLPRRAAADHTAESDWLPQASLSWQPDAHRTIGIKVARGYRGGGISYAPTLGLTRTFAAEHAWESEVFARVAPTGALRLSGALFQSRIADQQVPRNVAGGFPGIDTLIDNAAEAHRHGAELEAEWRPRSALALTGTLAWVKTEFRRLTLAGKNLAGQPFPNAPEWIASLGLDYHHAAGWFGSGLFSYAASTYSQVGSRRLTTLEQRRLLSGRLGYAWKQVRVYAFGSNLLDTDYALFRSDNTSLGISVTGKTGAPRLLGAGCDVRW